MLLLDEPAGGFPESELPELGEMIKKMAADAGVVVIEHRMDRAGPGAGAGPAVRPASGAGAGGSDDSQQDRRDA